LTWLVVLVIIKIQMVDLFYYANDIKNKD